ncbi:unknown protein [Desulfotalea psychrophila LSv54]|uniref:Uncharacterized protein n=1 Tax=Desulfotalea psychrophila (strain LSv54 / DSM 12343) TaxID=177439 RepID=Q6AIU7_DESPS|nr:unknown protein [Desulfotalea psychrophila LSv54]
MGKGADALGSVYCLVAVNSNGKCNMSVSKALFLGMSSLPPNAFIVVGLLILLRWVDVG